MRILWTASCSCSKRTEHVIQLGRESAGIRRLQQKDRRKSALLPGEPCQYDPRFTLPKTVEMLRKCRSVSRPVDPGNTSAGTNFALERIESPEFCFGGRSDGARAYLLPFFIPLVEQEFDE